MTPVSLLAPPLDFFSVKILIAECIYTHISDIRKRGRPNNHTRARRCQPTLRLPFCSIEHFPHFLQYFHRSQRLLDKFQTFVQHSPFMNDVCGIAADEERFRIWARLPDLIKRLFSVQIRHDDVENNKCDPLLCSRWISPLVYGQTRVKIVFGSGLRCYPHHSEMISHQRC